MKSEINYKYPSVEDLRKRAKCKIPKFAFEYLDGGCNEDVNLKKIQIEFEILNSNPSIWLTTKNRV